MILADGCGCGFAYVLNKKHNGPTHVKAFVLSISIMYSRKRVDACIMLQKMCAFRRIYDSVGLKIASPRV